MNNFGTLNWSILALYIVANLILGFFIGKKVSSTKDFFLGDKSIPYKLLKKIMLTCASADYTNISLAVNQKSQEEAQAL